jgi:hypothetical protein
VNANGALGLPEVSFDLKVDASATVAYTQGMGFETETSIDTVQFDNIALEIGSLLENILKPFAT